MNWLNFLLDASATSNASGYLPIGLQLIFAAGFVATMIGVSQWVGPKRKTSDKLETFASGIESHGDARQPMAIKYCHFIRSLRCRSDLFLPLCCQFQGTGLGWFLGSFNVCFLFPDWIYLYYQERSP
jgi:NADH:ubiquinone oxidoreductase subunit 3 (subunit A)